MRLSSQAMNLVLAALLSSAVAVCSVVVSRSAIPDLARIAALSTCAASMFYVFYVLRGCTERCRSDPFFRQVFVLVSLMLGCVLSSAAFVVAKIGTYYSLQTELMLMIATAHLFLGAVIAERRSGGGKR